MEMMLDIAIADDLKTEFETPARNVREDHAAELMSSEYSLPGVSDGGAHTKFITIGAYPTDLITWMVRDAGFMSLEEAHYRLSALPARGWRSSEILLCARPCAPNLTPATRRL